jgi:hypothetical protein
VNFNVIPALFAEETVKEIVVVFVPDIYVGLPTDTVESPDETVATPLNINVQTPIIDGCLVAYAMLAGSPGSLMYVQIKSVVGQLLESTGTEL